MAITSDSRNSTDEMGTIIEKSQGSLATLTTVIICLFIGIVSGLIVLWLSIRPFVAGSTLCSNPNRNWNLYKINEKTDIKTVNLYFDKDTDLSVDNLSALVQGENIETSSDNLVVLHKQETLIINLSNKAKVTVDLSENSRFLHNIGGLFVIISDGSNTSFTIRNGQSDNGGCFYQEWGSINFIGTNVIIENCTANIGGGIYISNGYLTISENKNISGGLFINNCEALKGDSGGIQNIYGTITVSSPSGIIECNNCRASENVGGMSSMEGNISLLGDFSKIRMVGCQAVNQCGGFQVGSPLFSEYKQSSSLLNLLGKYATIEVTECISDISSGIVLYEATVCSSGPIIKLLATQNHSRSDSNGIIDIYKCIYQSKWALSIYVNENICTSPCVDVLVRSLDNHIFPVNVTGDGRVGTS